MANCPIMGQGEGEKIYIYKDGVIDQELTGGFSISNFNGTHTVDYKPDRIVLSGSGIGGLITNKIINNMNKIFIKCNGGFVSGSYNCRVVTAINNYNMYKAFAFNGQAGLESNSFDMYAGFDFPIKDGKLIIAHEGNVPLQIYEIWIE